MDGIFYAKLVPDYTSYQKRIEAEFLGSELGRALVACVMAWARLKRCISSEDVLKYTQTKWEVFQLVLKDRFGKDYQMVLEADGIYCGVMSENEWLFRANLDTFKVEF